MVQLCNARRAAWVAKAISNHIPGAAGTCRGSPWIFIPRSASASHFFLRY